MQPRTVEWKLSIPTQVMEAVKRVNETGARALLVGGAVIDLLCERTPKDWDLEVFGLDYEQIKALFPDHPTKEVGKAFGVVKLAMDGVEIDINVPRVDNSTGAGHSDFEAILDPRMTAKEAARRRDFTINTLALNPVTGEIIDEWGGMKDLQDGVLRATDPDLFVQDPLRVFRAMQLLARKAETIDTKTLILIYSMFESLSALPKERIYEEFKKLFLKAPRPSVGLEFLRETGLLGFFPELKVLVGLPQKLEWHPEGDVWVHSYLAANAAAQLRHLIPEHQREAFMFGVFLHDVGKYEKTITQRMIDERDPRVKEVAEVTKRDPQDLLLTAIGHDQAGMDPAETFLRRLTDNKKLIKLTRGIVGEHMKPYNLNQGSAGKGAYARLCRKMQETGGDLRLLGHVCMCDACATSSDWQTRSLTTGGPNWEHITSEIMMDWADKFDVDASAVDPKVMGRDLIVRGMKGGPEVGKLLKKALDLQYEDPTLSKEDLINRVLPGGEA